MPLIPRFTDSDNSFLDRARAVGMVLNILGVACLFVYFGIKDALAYSSGRSVTQPWVDLLVVGAGIWMLAFIGRVLRGSGPQRRPLLSQGELLVLSAGVLVGAVWLYSFSWFLGIVCALLGLTGLAQWWGRRRAVSAQ